MEGFHCHFTCQLLLIVGSFVIFSSAMEVEYYASGTSGKTLQTRLGDTQRSSLPASSGHFDNESPRRSDRENVFRAVWDVPNYCEPNYGIKIPLGDYGIEFNKDHEWRVGDVINVFNHYNLGNYPYVKPSNGKYKNGGLPQLANLTEHLEKATNDILKAIPDAKYSGLAVIDWEWWYPHWDSVNEKYRNYSKDHVRKRHQHWDHDTIRAVAELEWTQGAKIFMESTIKLARMLRPKALWGFYHYPYCTVLGNNSSCKPGQESMNDDLLWLFNVSSTLYPSIYLKQEEADFRSAVRIRLAETFRIHAASSDPKGVVMSYTRFNYSSTSFYFTLEDLNNTILASAEFGTHGVVLWGDNFDDETSESCQELRDYVINALGPTVVMARKGAMSCSDRVCSGRGRCVGDILACGKASRRREMEMVERGWMKEDGGDDICSCRCFVGWEGNDCSRESV